MGAGAARLQLATYPQSPFSGPAHCCDVTDLYQAFSQRTGPGRLWISLDAPVCCPLSIDRATKKPSRKNQPKDAELQFRPVQSEGSRHRASVCITHAGLNTVLEALAQGVPQFAISVTHDQLGVASRIAAKKTGLVLPFQKLSVSR